MCHITMTKTTYICGHVKHSSETVMCEIAKQLLRVCAEAFCTFTHLSYRNFTGPCEPCHHHYNGQGQ